MSAYVAMIRERVTDQAEMDTYARLASRAREGPRPTGPRQQLLTTQGD